MPFEIVRNDITKMQVDAIVNAANERLLGGGGVDGAIHRAAGPGLLMECRLLGGCKTGQAKVTRGYRLPAGYVIHTVGPVWQGGSQGERQLLESCYRTCLALAKEHGCRSVAFPLISAGVYGYPKDQAIRVATNAIMEFLAENEMHIYLVIFDKAAFTISSKLFAALQAFIDDRYVERYEEAYPETRRMQIPRRRMDGPAESLSRQESLGEKMSLPRPAPAAQKAPEPCALTGAAALQAALKQMDESFSEMLLRKIDEKGMKDSQCYKKANIDRKLFSKIRSDRLYKPSKPTVLAFAIALELSLEETADMLRKAGFALSNSNKFDIIVEFSIRQGIYDVYAINEALFAFDQSLLGG